MCPTRRDPTLQELFDRVLRLEADNVRLRARVKETEKCIALFTQGFSEHSDSDLKSTLAIYKNLEELHDLVWPLVHKVFPKFAADQAAIDRILPPPGDAPRRKPRRDN